MILKRFGAGDVPKAPAGSFVGTVGGQATQFVHRRIEGLDWIVVVALPLARSGIPYAPCLI